jgi:hypothetical protein
MPRNNFSFANFITVAKLMLTKEKSLPAKSRLCKTGLKGKLDFPLDE